MRNRKMILSRRNIILALLLGLCGLIVVEGCRRVDNETKKRKVGVTYIVHHPLLEQARQGFMDTLESEGFVEGENLTVYFQSAQGEAAAANQIVSDFLGKDVDLIYTISTPSTKAAVEKTKTIPIIFSAVTDPKGSGIVADMDNPGGNVTGYSNYCAADQHMRFLRLVLPNAKKIGIPYNPGEPSAASSVDIIKPAAKEAGIEIFTASAPNTAAVADAVASLMDKCDAIYIVPDNTMGAAINVVADICSRRGIPMLSSESDTVMNKQALASITVDHYKMGQDAGKMAVAVLRENKKPGEMPVITNKHPVIHVSRSMAEKLGITFSAEAESALTFVE